jgi:DNA-binding IclR family transcriptional regulator
MEWWSMINSLGRGLKALTTLAEAGGTLGVTELAERLGVDPSSSYRLLATLEQHGFVRQESTGRKYTLGYAVIALAAAVLRKLDAVEAAGPYLRGLAADTGESAHLAVLDGINAVFVAREIADAVLRVDSTIGASEPAYCTAVGKALVADFNGGMLAQRFGPGPYTAFTPRTIITLDALVVEAQRTRARGYAYDDQETHPGVRCFAAPVRDHLGQTIAAIGISGPVGRLTRERLPVLAEAVRLAAEQVSIAMGFGAQDRARA